MMTVPGEQFVIRRMAYAMIKKAFDENGIKFAFPTVQVAGEAEAATAAAAVAQRGLELTQRSRVTDRKDALFAVSCSPGRPVTAYRFQFGERLDKAFESIPRGATLGGRERDLERRIRRRYRHCPLRSRQIPLRYRPPAYSRPDRKLSGAPAPFRSRSPRQSQSA
jgi:hypothetical protein